MKHDISDYSSDWDQYLMSSANFYPTIGTQDGWGYATTFNNTFIGLALGKYFDDSFTTFITFPGVTIPQGSTIQSCIVSLYPHFSTDLGGVCIQYGFNDVGNAVTPIDISELYGIVTGSKIDWNNIARVYPPDLYSSPELSTILQPIINRSDWTSGNALQIIITDNNSPANSRHVPSAYEDDPFNPPCLTVTWTPVGVQDGLSCYQNVAQIEEVSENSRLVTYQNVAQVEQVSSSAIDTHQVMVQVEVWGSLFYFQNVTQVEYISEVSALATHQLTVQAEYETYTAATVNAKQYTRVCFYMSAAGSTALFNVECSQDGVLWEVCKENWNPGVTGWNEAAWNSHGAQNYWRVRLMNTPGAGPDVMEIEWYSSEAALSGYYISSSYDLGSPAIRRLWLENLEIHYYGAGTTWETTFGPDETWEHKITDASQTWVSALAQEPCGNISIEFHYSEYENPEETDWNVIDHFELFQVEVNLWKFRIKIMIENEDTEHYIRIEDCTIAVYLPT